MRQGGAPHHSGAEQLVPTIVFHGDRDTTVSPINGDQVIAQSKAGSDLQSTVSRGQAPGGISYTRTVASDVRCHRMLEHWVLHGAGHAWSGGSPSGSYTEPKGPDAKQVSAGWPTDAVCDSILWFSSGCGSWRANPLLSRAPHNGVTS
jgi:poly(3-hydroxybutyrate) depolymerase